MLRKDWCVEVQAPDSISITRVASWHGLPHPEKVPMMGEHPRCFAVSLPLCPLNSFCQHDQAEFFQRVFSRRGGANGCRLQGHMFVQTNVVLLQFLSSISVHQTLSQFRFSFPGWKSLCDRSSRFLTFQLAHVTETSVDRTDATTFRRVRSWTTNAGNQTTNGRVMRVPAGVRQDVSTSKKASTRASRALAVYLRSSRHGRKSTISEC